MNDKDKLTTGTAMYAAGGVVTANAVNIGSNIAAAGIGTISTATTVVTLTGLTVATCGLGLIAVGGIGIIFFPKD